MTLPATLPPHYRETISAIVERLKDRYQPEKIILYGSCARGEVTPWSDIDMLIIKPSTQPRHQRSTEVLRTVRDLRATVPFEPVVLTPQEFTDNLAQRHFLLQDILRDGNVLYERN